ncbi:MAG: lipopolysaccharide biosynthesis protein, partial [Candidatus Sericytochromatia bacterium]|nr:lipopolysaccharide biosynthesis protein [Candidatus Sericytochromatia bacterium]
MMHGTSSPMPTLRLIIRNAGYLIGETVTLQVLSLLSAMILTRHLHANGYGQYAFSYVFSWFLMLLLMLGTKGVILRDVPRCREQAGHYLVQVLLLRSLMAIGAVFLAVLAGRWLDKPPEVQTAMALFMLLSATDAIALTFVDVFRSLEDMRKEGWIYATERAAVLVGVWFAARHQWGLVPIVQMMYGLALLRTVAWLWPVYRWIEIPKVVIDFAFLGYLCREGWQYLRVDLASAVVQRADDNDDGGGGGHGGGGGREFVGVGVGRRDRGRCDGCASRDAAAPRPRHLDREPGGPHRDRPRPEQLDRAGEHREIGIGARI